ncbi:hypothetical protein EDD16DRAFT_1773567 [Pisolithus croceorrhizus]|nr:hypothetical protein EDD16DRAFT_1773567 [Pisolithus croceorrhizus]KAI6166414.1 hypothetical protein EDD17DRAFT_1505314 [Pisolithus thermaeus]
MPTHCCSYCFKPIPTASGVMQYISQTPACQQWWEDVLEQEVTMTLEIDDMPALDCKPYNGQYELELDCVPNGTPDPHEGHFVQNLRVHDKSEHHDLCQSQFELKQIDDTPIHSSEGCFTKKFDGIAAKILGSQETVFESMEAAENMWAPFHSEEEWELARFLMKNIGQTKMDEFLKLDIIWQNGVSFDNAQSLLKYVDKLCTGPAQTCKMIDVEGDIVTEDGCMWELMGNPAFWDVMSYVPECAYADAKGKNHIYDEMWTGKCWQNIQPHEALIDRINKKKIPEGGVVAPVILSSNKMNLSQFSRDKKSNWHGDLEECMWCCTADTLKTLKHMRKNKQSRKFDAKGLHAVFDPFWKELPFTNIFICLTPNILHQLHKGVFHDHLIQWCLSIVGEKEIDAHFQAMTQYPNLCHFKKGISSVSQWTGTEHKEMARVFVGLLASAANDHVLIVAHSLLDFIYYVQLQQHTATTLTATEESLKMFHTHKHVLVKLQVQEDFNVPKIHSMKHYISSIQALSGADGDNTEYPKCLHIDCGKDRYQMALWLQHQEAIHYKSTYLAWRKTHANSDLPDALLLQIPVNSWYKVAKNPPHHQVSIVCIKSNYNAPEFIPALKHLLASHLDQHQVIQPSPSDRFIVYNHLYIDTRLSITMGHAHTVHKIHASPKVGAHGQKVQTPARVNTMFMQCGEQPHMKTFMANNVQIAQVWVIFNIPHHLGSYPHPLAYVKWFTALQQHNPVSGLFIITHSTQNCCHNVSIISVDCTCRREISSKWTADSVIEKATSFYVNSYIDLDMFLSLEYKSIFLMQAVLWELKDALTHDELITFAKWKEEMCAWEADPLKMNPFDPKVETLTQATIWLQLVKDDVQTLRDGTQVILHNDISPSMLIRSGLDLEEQHSISLILILDVIFIWIKHPYVCMSQIVKRDSWTAGQQLYMLVVGIICQHLSTANSRTDQPEGYALCLPFTIVAASSTCNKILMEHKWKLRHAQAHDALHSLHQTLWYQSYILKFKD